MSNNGNPVFRRIDKNQQTMGAGPYVETTEAAVTWPGIISKTLILVAVAIAAGIAVWFLPFPVLIVLLIVGVIASFIAVIIGTTNPAKAKGASLVYAFFQGIMYGTLTAIIDLQIPGVGLMALGATFGILLVMAGLHSIGAVRATPRLVRFIMATLISVMLVSVVTLVIGLISPSYMETVYANFPLMIIISAFLIIVGALMLIVDFDNAKNLVNSGAPKVYEWQVSLGIMVTLVWIYLRVLRFISILASRNRK